MQPYCNYEDSWCVLLSLVLTLNQTNTALYSVLMCHCVLCMSHAQRGWYAIVHCALCDMKPCMQSRLILRKDCKECKGIKQGNSAKCVPCVIFVYSCCGIV